MRALYIGMTWIFRIQSEHKRVFAKQRKPERWHQKSALLGILIILSESMGFLSMIPMTWQSLLFLHTWSLRDISNLRAPISVNWTSFPVIYWALIGNDKNAAWLHLLQLMFPNPGHSSSLKWSWLCKAEREMSDNSYSPHGLSCSCTHSPSLLQSQELICVPVQDPCLSNCVQSTGLNWVLAHLLHQLFEGRSFTGTWFYSLKISTSRGDTSHMSFGSPLHHENKPAEHSLYFSVDFGVRSFVPFSWQIEHLSH